MKTRLIKGEDLKDGMTLVGFMDRTAVISRVRKGRQYVHFHNDTLGINDRVALDFELFIQVPEEQPGNLYRVSVNVTADDATGAARMVGEALGFDQNSVHEIGGLSVDLLPDEKRFLVCRGCGEACDGIISATEHGVSDVSGCGGWCGEEGFDIVPESEAL